MAKNPTEARVQRITTLLALGFVLTVPAIGQHTHRASVDSFGSQGNNHSFSPALSATGRYVAFASSASNLVPFDTNGVEDVFVHDTQLGTTRRVSVDSSGGQLNGPSGIPAYSPGDFLSEFALSADGRRIAFLSMASNLAGSVAFTSQVYVRDLDAGTTTLASANLTGVGAASGAFYVTLSGDGRHVVFCSLSDDLVSNDTLPNSSDVFVRDLVTQTTTRLASATSSPGSTINVFEPVVSSNGRYVAYHRFEQVTSPTYHYIADVLVVDRDTDADGVFDEPGATNEINITQQGQNGYRIRPSISASGRFLTYLDSPQTIYRYDRDADDDGIFDEPGATSESFLLNPSQGFTPVYSRSPISSDGRYFAFLQSTDPGSGQIDQLFVRDVQTGTSRLVSYSGTTGAPAQGDTRTGILALSADGTRAAFDSNAANLVLSDTNQRADVFVFRLDGPDCLGTTTYCIGAPNSVGLGALIGWAGSLAIADDQFILTATGLPANTAGLFFYGPDQQQVPFGNGHLCVAPGSAGLFRVGASQANPLGQVVRQLNLHTPPMSAGPGAVTAGSAWNFQFWYRNPAGGGAGYNTTDALHAVFCP